MDVDTLRTISVDDSGEATSASRADYLLDLLELSSRHIALLAACIAMGSSLFLSEVIGWPPCVLCWYQRILMYPLTLILAIGIWRRDNGLHLYVLPLSIMGAGTSLYHYLLIKTDWFPPPPCATGVPCTVDYLNWFGFINIPFLALTAFLIITCMMSAWVLVCREDVDDQAAFADDRGASPTPSPVLDGSRLAVVMISISVVLGLMVASTQV